MLSFNWSFGHELNSSCPRIKSIRNVIKFNCPNCDATINARDDQAGAKGRCKKCRKVVEVPEGAPVPPNLPSNDFDDAGEWGESYGEDGYDDASEDPNDLYRQLPPTGKKTIAREQFWLKHFRWVGIVSAYIAGIGVTLVGLSIGAIYAWRNLPQVEPPAEPVPQIAAVQPAPLEIQDDPADWIIIETAFLEFETGRKIGDLAIEDYSALVRKFSVGLAMAKKGIKTSSGVRKFGYYERYAMEHSIILSRMQLRDKRKERGQSFDYDNELSMHESLEAAEKELDQINKL
jgi:hypothetical protein